LAVFVALLAVFTFLGFYGMKWRKGDLRLLHEWALAGRRLGWFVVWFLLGADLFTAYTFIAVPSGMLASGPLYFFAVPYVAWGFAVALITMPKLWEYSKEKGYVTAADFVKDRFGSKSLSVLVALVSLNSPTRRALSKARGSISLNQLGTVGLSCSAGSTKTFMPSALRNL